MIYVIVSTRLFYKAILSGFRARFKVESAEWKVESTKATS